MNCHTTALSIPCPSEGCQNTDNFLKLIWYCMTTMTPFFKKQANLHIIGIPGRDHNSMQLDIHHRKKNEKRKDYMETKQHSTKILMGQCGNQKIA